MKYKGEKLTVFVKVFEPVINFHHLLRYVTLCSLNLTHRHIIPFFPPYSNVFYLLIRYLFSPIPVLAILFPYYLKPFFTNSSVANLISLYASPYSFFPLFQCYQSHFIFPYLYRQIIWHYLLTGGSVSLVTVCVISVRLS